MRAAARWLDRLSAGLNALALWGAVLAVLAMVLAAGWQVVARYALAAPPIWTEEAARRAMVWAGMLGASCAFRMRADPVLFPAMRETRGNAGLALALLRAAGVAGFAGPVIWFSFFGPGMSLSRGFLGRSLERSAEMIPLPMIWFTAAVPAGFALIAVHAAAELAVRLAEGDRPAGEGAR